MLVSGIRPFSRGLEHVLDFWAPPTRSLLRNLKEVAIKKPDYSEYIPLLATYKLHSSNALPATTKCIIDCKQYVRLTLVVSLASWFRLTSVPRTLELASERSDFSRKSARRSIDHLREVIG